MRRVIVALVIALILIAAVAPVATAAKPSNTCPAESSGWFLVDRDEWWAVTVEGFEAAGIPVYEADGVTFTQAFNDFAVAFGLADGAALEAFVRGEQWDSFDHNQNGLACMKVLPDTRGHPSWAFGGVDDQASTKRGESS